MDRPDRGAVCCGQGPVRSLGRGSGHCIQEEPERGGPKPHAVGRLCGRSGAVRPELLPHLGSRGQRDGSAAAPAARVLVAGVPRRRVHQGKLQDQNAGVFLGIASNDAVEVSSKAAASATSVYSANGTSHSTAVGRVSFTFGLQGPCAAYDTACSSALVALHAGVRGLQNGDCDLALVSGVNVMLTATLSRPLPWLA